MLGKETCTPRKWRHRSVLCPVAAVTASVKDKPGWAILLICDSIAQFQRHFCYPPLGRGHRLCQHSTSTLRLLLSFPSLPFPGLLLGSLGWVERLQALKQHKEQTWQRLPDSPRGEELADLRWGLEMGCYFSLGPVTWSSQGNSM